MPKLPTIESSRGINTGTTGAQASPRDFYGGGGGTVARALGDVAGVAQVAMRVKEQREDFDARIWVSENTTTLETESYDKIVELQSDPDALEKYQQWSRERMAALESAAPNKRAADGFRVSANNTFSSGYRTMAAAASEVKVLRAEIAVDSTLTADIQNATKAKERPGIMSPAALLERGIASVDTRVDAVYGGVAPKKSESKKQSLKVGYVTAATNMGEFESARAMIETHITDPEVKRTLLNRIETDERQVASATLDGATEHMNEQVQRASLGFSVQPLGEALRSALARYYPGRLARHDESIAQIEGARKQFSSWTDEGLSSLERKQKAYQMAESGAINTQAYRILTEMAGHQEKLERESPVDAAVTYSAPARRAAMQYATATNAAINNPADEGLRNAANAASEVWFSTVDKVQAGVPKELRSYLSREDKDKYKAFLEKARNRGEAMQAWNSISAFMPDHVRLNVFDEIAPKNMGRLMLDASRWSIAPELFGALDSFDANKKINPKAATTIAKTARKDKTLEALGRVWMGDRWQDSATVASYYEGVSALALGYVVRDGMTESDAVKGAAKKIVDDNYKAVEVNGMLVLLDRTSPVEPEEFAAASKFAMGLIPWDEVSEFQVNGAKVGTSKATDAYIDAHYLKLKENILRSGLLIPIPGVGDIQPNPFRWAMATANEFEWARNKRDPNYFLKAHGWNNGFLRRHGDRYHLHMRLADGTSTAIMDKEGKQFYLTEQDLANPVPTETIRVSAGVGGQGVEAYQPRKPKAGDASPWRR